VKTITERGDDPEISASAPHRPEQINILGVARRNRTAVRHDDIGPDEIVAGRPIKAHQPAITAAQGQSGNADLGIRTAGNRQTRGLGRAVELGP
jgi:hypothetical protein